MFIFSILFSVMYMYIYIFGESLLRHLSPSAKFGPHAMTCGTLTWRQRRSSRFCDLEVS